MSGSCNTIHSITGGHHALGTRDENHSQIPNGSWLPQPNNFYFWLVQPRKTFVSPTLENYWHRNNYKQYTHIFCSIHSAGFDLVIYFQHWLLIVHIYPRGPNWWEVIPPGRIHMLDTHRTISILMFFADHKETRERRLSFCKSLTVNASIGNADKNACCWLKLIRYSLSACALDRVSSAVPHCKSTGNEVYVNVCTSASYLVGADVFLMILMDLFPHLFKIKPSFTRSDEEKDNWTDRSYWPVYRLSRSPTNLFLAGKLYHWASLYLNVRLFSHRDCPSFKLSRSRRSFSFHWCVPFPAAIHWITLNDPVCRV